MGNTFLVVVTGSFPARSETFIREHAVGMAQREWRTSVLASSKGGGMHEGELEAIDKAGVKRIYRGALSANRVVRVLQMFGHCFRDPRTIKWLNGHGAYTRPEMLAAAMKIRALEQTGPGVVHIHFGTNAGRLLAAGWSKPSIVTWHGYDANIMPRIRGNRMYEKLFASDWQHTVGSDFMKKRLVELGAKPGRVVKIPMGVDLNRFSYVDRSGRKKGPLNIVSVGRLAEEKGHAYLIQAVSLLKSRGLAVALRIIGDGPLRASLASLIEHESLEQSVTLLGAQNSEVVAQELAEADAFALTGVVVENGCEETQGVVYIEAQATGLPVVACDVGGVSESLVDGETGYLLPSKDVSAIADALTTYASDSALRLRHGRTAREFIERKYSLERMLAAFEELYSR